jgi:predicted glycosyltransferase
MRYLFFFVHPSKYHLFRVTINRLISKGHQVDVLITSKDVLEDLVKKEEWDFKNIFPKGRKIKWLPVLISAAINSIRTIWKIFNLTKGRDYDLFITDDLSVINAKIHNVPSILFTDDHADSIPETKLLMYFATKILSPDSTDLGRFESKKIGFDGYKQSAYLREKYFEPNHDILKKINSERKDYFLIRCVSLNATHDVGKTGLTNSLVRKLVQILEEHGKVFIISERNLPQDLQSRIIDLPPEEIHSAIKYSRLFIGDSQTMCAEAGFLGTYFIWYSHFAGKVGYLDEMVNKYGLGVGIDSNKEEILITETKNFINMDIDVAKRALKMRNNTIDLTEFMLKLIESFNE